MHGLSTEAQTKAPAYAVYLTLLLASLLFYLVMGALCLRQRDISLAHPVTLYLVFHGFIFVLRPLVAYWYDFDFVYRLYDFQPSLTDKMHAILAADLACATFVFFAFRFARSDYAPVGGIGFAALRERLTKPILLCVAAITPFAIWSLASSWGKKASGFDTMIVDAATGAHINTTGVGYFTDLGMTMAPMSVLVLWVMRYRPIGWAYFALFAILQAGTGTRGPLIFAIAALAILWLFEANRRWIDWRLLLAVPVTLIAFNQIVLDRGGAVREVVSRENSTRYVTQHELAPLEHMDFANLEYLEYTIYAVPQRTGTYDYFAANLQIFTEPVPRVLWKEKPVGSPVQFFSLWDYGSPVGMTLSVPGNGWMALGYPGVFVQALLFAFIFGVAYRVFVARRGDARSLLIYAIFAASATIILRDGALISLLRIAPFYFGPLIVVLMLERMWFADGKSKPLRAGLPQPASPTERRRQLARQGRLPAQNP